MTKMLRHLGYGLDIAVIIIMVLSGFFSYLNNNPYGFYVAVALGWTVFMIVRMKDRKSELARDIVRTRRLEPVVGKVMITYKQFKDPVNNGLPFYTGDYPENIVIEPTYMTEKAVGADCFASKSVIIEPGQIKAVMTGIKAKFNGEDEGLFPFIRSSIPKKKGLFLANGVGVVEEDYYSNEDNDGDIGFMFYNYTDKPVHIERFERLGQIVLMPILRFENGGHAGLERGASGSSNK